MSSKPKSSRLLGVIVGALLIAGSVYAVFFVDWGTEIVEEVQPVRPLKMLRVGATSLPAVREYPGKVTARDTVELAFQVEGQIIEMPILNGQEVKKGDLLARLDDRDYKNRQAAAQAQFDQTKVQLERVQRASETGAVSQTDLTNAKAAFESARANLEITKKALEDTVLRAPYDAVISNTFAENFQDVQAKETVLGIQNIQSIEVEVSVPQERILRSKDSKGKYRFIAVFDSLPDTQFDVETKEYTTQADPLTQTYAVTFTMPAQEDYVIFPGMTATVREQPIEGAFPVSDRLLVPIDAAPVDGQGQYYVWKVTEEGENLTVNRQDVTVGEAMGSDIEILEGLSKGDRIAAQGVHLLQAGQQVREYSITSQED